MQMNVRIFPSKLGDVRFKSCVIEPMKHLIELLTEDRTDHWERNLLKFYPLAKNATKDLRSLDVGYFAPGNLQCNTNNLLAPFNPHTHHTPHIFHPNPILPLA